MFLLAQSFFLFQCDTNPFLFSMFHDLHAYTCVCLSCTLTRTHMRARARTHTSHEKSVFTHTRTVQEENSANYDPTICQGRPRAKSIDIERGKVKTKGEYWKMRLFFSQNFIQLERAYNHRMKSVSRYLIAFRGYIQVDRKKRERERERSVDRLALVLLAA